MDFVQAGFPLTGWIHLEFLSQRYTLLPCDGISAVKFV